MSKDDRERLVELQNFLAGLQEKINKYSGDPTKKKDLYLAKSMARKCRNEINELHKKLGY